jgi:hypothetical protein
VLDTKSAFTPLILICRELPTPAGSNGTATLHVTDHLSTKGRVRIKSLQREGPRPSAPASRVAMCAMTVDIVCALPEDRPAD